MTPNPGQRDGVSSQPMAPSRVLVVDDAKSGRDMLTRRLEQDGHHADVAEDGDRP